MRQFVFRFVFILGFFLLAHPAHAIWEAQLKSGLDGKLEGHKQEVFSLAFSPNGELLASGSFDGSTRVWDTTTWKTLYTLAGHSNWIGAVKFSPDGQRLYTGGLDKQVQIWNTKTGENLHTLKSHHKGILSLALTQDGRYLASGSLNGEIHVHDTKSWKLIHTFKGNAGGISALTFSPDGKFLGSAGYNDLLIKIWDISKDKLSFTLAHHTAELYALVFSPNGEFLASGGEDQVIRLWSMKNRSLTSTLAGHLKPVWTLVFSPDSQTLVSGTVGDQTIRFWTVPQGVNTQTLPGIKTKTYALAMHPKGHLLVSGHEDKLLRIWKNESSSATETPPVTLNDVIQVNGYRVDDDQSGQSMGNKNGEANRGELVEIELQFKNILKATAKDVSFEIQLKDNAIKYQSPANRFVVQEFEGEGSKSLPVAVFIPKSFKKPSFDIEVTVTSKEPFWKKVFSVTVQVK